MQSLTKRLLKKAHWSRYPSWDAAPFARNLARSFALLGVLQNDIAPLIIDDSPFFDLLQGSKAAQAGEVIVQAAIAYAGGLNSAVGITHGSAQLQGVDLITVAKQDPGNTSQGQPRIPSISTKIALCRRIRLRSRVSTRPLMC